MATRLILCSHGRFAEGLLEAARMISGGMEDVEAFSLMPGVSADQYAAEVRSSLDKMMAEGTDAFLCLADLFGGTPSNTLLSLIKDYPITVVTGLNLAMLIETYFMSSSSSCDELADVALGTLQQSGRIVRRSDFE